MNTAAAAVSISTDKILAATAGGIGYLKLNQPEKHNAISYAMWLAIAEVMESFRGDDDVRVIVLSGEGGRAFSAGADISEFSSNRSTDEQIELYEAAGRAGVRRDQALPQAGHRADRRLLRRRRTRGRAVRGSAHRHRRFQVRHPRREARPRLLPQEPAPARGPGRGRRMRRKFCSPPDDSLPSRRSGWGS